jgi:hypothetical protein
VVVNAHEEINLKFSKKKKKSEIDVENNLIDLS